MRLIQKLQQKKYRDEHQFFVAEGPKVVSEFLNSGFFCEALYSISDNDFFTPNRIPTKISADELRKISSLVTPNDCLAVFRIPVRGIEFSGRGLIADRLRDPGNLGTLIRICDWFDIRTLVLSDDSVDCYNPKVVQATMGSLARVSVQYVDLGKWMPHQKLPILGALLEGQSIYDVPMPKEGWLIVGSESHGISKGLLEHISQPITIPRFGAEVKTESLNVAVATSIILGEWSRQLETN